MSANQPHRLFLLDIMRIFCAIQIYMYHSTTMYGCSYGYYIDALLRNLTSPVMSCFFLLSGFSIHYQHRLENGSEKWIRHFLKKRFIAILPSYFLFTFIWPLIHPEQLKEWIILLPVDILGIQTVYRTLFGILHNGGTWFVSCILLCYLCYPVMKAILSSNQICTSIILILLTHFILMYSNIVIRIFTLDTLYSNPIARTAEFMIGVSFSEIVFRRKSSAVTKISKVKQFFENSVGVIICTIIISVVVAKLNHAELKAIVFEYLSISLVLVALYLSTRMRCLILENSRLLSSLSGMSYQFFLAQLFLWIITDAVLRIFGVEGNSIKILTSFFICVAISYFTWRFFDKWIRNKLKKKFLQ